MKIIIPDSDKVRMIIVKEIIKRCSDKRLQEINIFIMKYPDSIEKQEIQEQINKEYIKRHITE